MSRPGEKPGIALLGCGEAAAMHADTLSSVAPGRPLYFASRDPARARAFAGEYGGAGHFGSYEAALDDPRVGVALILTPPTTHRTWCEAALERGCDVIVEKPAFVTPDEFDAVEVVARRAGRRVLVAENYPYKPLAGALRRILARGEVGDLLFVRVDAVKHQEAGGWRNDPRLAGGGALLEGGIHWVSFLGHLGPRITRVRAVRPGVDVERPERSMALLFEYEGGGAASLSYSWQVPSALRGLRLSHLHGTGGSATFETNGLFVALRGERWALRLPGLRDIGGYGAMFGDLLGALDEGRAPRYDLADARWDVELVQAAYADAGEVPPAIATSNEGQHR